MAGELRLQDLAVAVAVAALPPALFLVFLLGKVGDAFGPALVATRPLLLLVLNANDTFVALTTPNAPLALAFVIATLRRLVEDLLFFAGGWMYGDAAVALVPWIPIPKDEKLLKQVHLNLKINII